MRESLYGISLSQEDKSANLTCTEVNNPVQFVFEFDIKWLLAIGVAVYQLQSLHYSDKDRAGERFQPEDTTQIGCPFWFLSSN